MSVTLSPTPSLIEERKEKKRRILSWIMAQARATRSGSPTGAKSASPLPPPFPPIQNSKKISISKGNDKTMSQPYSTHVYTAQPIPTIPTAPNIQIVPGQNYSGSSTSTLYNAFPGPTPYTYRLPQPNPSTSTGAYLNRDTMPMPSPPLVGAGALEEEAAAELTKNVAAGSVAPEASGMPQAAGIGQPSMVSITTHVVPGQTATQPSISTFNGPGQAQETVPPMPPTQAPAALSATTRERVPVTAPGAPGAASYTSTGGVPMPANAANLAGIQGAMANPQPMTIVNIIPGQASSPPMPAPQLEPISSQPFVSHDYAYPAPPLPAVASRSPEPVSRSRPMHREEVDASASRSRASRGVSRSPPSQYNSPIPPDYVPVSQGSASRSRHAHTRPRAITPPMADHPRAIHADTSSPPAVSYQDAPRETHYYSTSPRHGDSHGYGHSDSRHRNHHGDHEHGHGHSNRHRSSSQPARDHHHHHHHRHHHRHHRDPQHSSSSRPAYARQRSYSLDAGDHRMRSSRAVAAYPGHAPYGYGSGYNSSAAHPQMMPQPHSPVYPSYTPSQPTPATPMTAGGIGAAGTTAGSAGQYRISVQPPTSAYHQPVGAPVADGRGGYSVVPHVGQTVHVLQKPSRSMPGGSGGAVPGPSGIDSRGRQSSPGFWSSLFGRKGRSSSAVPVQGNNYPQQNSQYGYSSSQPVQYYQANNRPRHSRRRSSHN